MASLCLTTDEVHFINFIFREKKREPTTNPQVPWSILKQSILKYYEAIKFCGGKNETKEI